MTKVFALFTMRLSKPRKFFAAIALFLAFVFAFIGLVEYLHLHDDAVFVPDYKMLDLTALADKTSYDDEDYRTLFFQTGLGKSAIDALKNTDGFLQKLNSFQANFFSAGDNFSCVREALTTSMEYKTKNSFAFAPYSNGYIIAMLSSHSLGWRHGHAGIIIGNNKTLEAPIINEPSKTYPLTSWQQYPTFIMLKLKDVSDYQLDVIATESYKNLCGVFYSPLAGIGEKFQIKPKRVQCAYLVWNAFYAFGYDLDSDGGMIVTVDDIINSDKLEIVQVYGVDPQRFIKLL